MNTSKIVILKDVRPEFASSSDALVITFEELKHWIKKGSIIKHSFRYQNARFLTHRLEVIYKPFVVAVLMRLLSRGVCRFEDEQGYRLEVNTRTLLNLFGQLVRDFMQKTAFVDQINQEVEQLSSRDQSLKATRNLDLPAVPVYLRTDLVFGLRSGGSVGHIAGVLNSLDSFTGKPIFLTTDTISTVRGDTETHLILPGQEFRDFRELPSLYLNKIFEQDALKILGNVELSFIYQRYSLNNFVGVKLAKAYGVPFVLEYNGSEIWVNRNWDRPLKYESLSERIELLNLKAADVVVVISQPLKDELVGRGIEADKILVNPNGVNPEIYSPEVDGSVIRSKYDLEGKTVIGFIGTFGRWHGAEVLAEAFGRLLREVPEYRERVHLLMIGDGVTMPQVKENLARYNVADACILTGIIPQTEGPAHLAACDILASPHVPNPDGTPFFGSPTKLFEYMAMGKGIVASDLDQIGEVLEHNRTAWMVKPGDVKSLVAGLKTLIEDRELRERLGQAARSEVVAKYTWKEHTRKIIEKLKERCG